MKYLWVLLSLVVLLGATAAWAGPADDAAIAADKAVTEHCAEGWGDRSSSPAALMSVTETLKVVQDAYELEKTPFLLYWRGALYKCLGQFEFALDDLEAFVKAERANPAYASQVKVAAVQLERAGRALEAAGGGDTAKWIRRTDPFEVALRLGAGVAVRMRYCSEDVSQAGIYASHCLGRSPTVAYAVGPVPIAGRFALTGFFAPPIGVGLSLAGGWAWPDESRVTVDPSGATEIEILNGNEEPFSKNNSIDIGVTQPAFIAAIGPVIRVANWQSEGRASGLRIEPAFAVGFSYFEPFAGHFDWYTQTPRFQTFGGEWLAVNIGASLRVAGQSELSNRALLLGDVRAAAFGPATGDLLIQTREAGGNVLLPLDPEHADRVTVDGGFTVLLVPPGPGAVALGPDLHLGFEGRWLAFPEGVEYTWDADADPNPDEPTNRVATPHWKVMTTTRIKISVVLGLTVEFGGAAKQ